jgi:hypothetical protein
VQLRRRSGEAELFSYRYEISQMPKFHAEATWLLTVAAATKDGECGGAVSLLNDMPRCADA